MGSIIFPLRVAPLRIENNFKEHWIEKPPKKIKLRQYISLLNSPNFDAANIKCCTVMTMHRFTVTIHARIRKSRQGVQTTFFESLAYFTEGRTDLLEDLMSPIASRGGGPYQYF